MSFVLALETAAGVHPVAIAETRPSAISGACELAALHSLPIVAVDTATGEIVGQADPQTRLWHTFKRPDQPPAPG